MALFGISQTAPFNLSTMSFWFLCWTLPIQQGVWHLCDWLWQIMVPVVLYILCCSGKTIHNLFVGPVWAYTGHREFSYICSTDDTEKSGVAAASFDADYEAVRPNTWNNASRESSAETGRTKTSRWLFFLATCSFHSLRVELEQIIKLRNDAECTLSMHDLLILLIAWGLAYIKE